MNKHIIYLAAGNSRRFGTNKLLHMYGEKPLFRHSLDMLSDFCGERPDCSLLVVTQYQEILRQVETSGIRAVYSPESPKGMSFTIKAALHALGVVPEEDFLLFVVADQPYLTGQTMGRLADCAAPGVEAASVIYEGKPGSPTLFSARLIPELLALQGDEGGRKVLRGHSCIFVEAQEEWELYDIDTKDYKYK